MNQFVRSEILTAMLVRVQVIWNVMLPSS